MDYLRKWEDDLKIIAWKQANKNTWPSTEIPRIAKLFKDFFPTDTYTQNANIPPKNFLVELLIQRNESSFKSLLEIYRILKYYIEHPDKDSIRLKNNEGQVNFNEFRERLFELYVNMLFNENQLTTRIDENYLVENSVVKPIDSVLYFCGEKYLIECTMINISKVSKFNNLCTNIQKSISRFSKDFHISEIFNCYIGFKDKKISKPLYHKAYEEFNALLKSYFADYRNNPNKTIKPLYKKTAEEYEIILQSDYLAIQEANEEFQNRFPNYILINNENVDNLSGLFKQVYHLRIDHSDLKDKITRKIKEKKVQHSKAPHPNRIIVIGAETILFDKSVKYRNPDLKEIIRQIDFERSLKQGITVLFLIKEYAGYHYKLHIGLAARKDINKDLKTRLEGIKINLR